MQYDPCKDRHGNSLSFFAVFVCCIFTCMHSDVVVYSAVSLKRVHIS